MKGYLITSDNCAPCATLKEELAESIKNGEISEVNLEREPERAVEMMEKYNLGLPGLVILGKNGELIVTS